MKQAIKDRQNRDTVTTGRSNKDGPFYPRSKRNVCSGFGPTANKTADSSMKIFHLAYRCRWKHSFTQKIQKFKDQEKQLFQEKKPTAL